METLYVAWLRLSPFRNRFRVQVQLFRLAIMAQIIKLYQASQGEQWTWKHDMWDRNNNRSLYNQLRLAFPKKLWYSVDTNTVMIKPQVAMRELRSRWYQELFRIGYDEDPVINFPSPKVTGILDGDGTCWRLWEERKARLAAEME